MTELPLVVIDVQRGGPSTGLPTKTEQSDLLQAMFGRNGDSPVVVIAPQSPADCFDGTIEACRIALQHMVPVILLTDGYIANGAEPWLVPDPKSFDRIEVTHPTNPDTFEPYSRDDRLVRPWAIPGMAGFEHRVGGLEKQHITGNVSYDPANHHRMTMIRREKIERIAQLIPPVEPHGSASGELLVVGWGGTYGSILTAVNRARARGHSVSSLHLRYLNPMPRNLGEVLGKFKKILVPELNTGQLRLLLRGKFLVDARGFNKIYGKPFLVEELEQAIDRMVSGQWGEAEFLTPTDFTQVVAEATEESGG